MTVRSCAGARASRCSRPSSASAERSSCRSSRTSSTARCSRSSPSTSRATNSPCPPAGAGVSVASGSSGAIAPERRSAPMTMPQKRVASVSPRSTATHAGAPGSGALRSHDDRSIVLPLPAGAHSRVTGPATPSSSNVNRRGRPTRPATSLGTAGTWMSAASAIEIHPTPGPTRRATLFLTQLPARPVPDLSARSSAAASAGRGPRRPRTRRRSARAGRAPRRARSRRR